MKPSNSGHSKRDSWLPPSHPLWPEFHQYWNGQGRLDRCLAAEDVSSISYLTINDHWPVCPTTLSLTQPDWPAAPRLRASNSESGSPVTFTILGPFGFDLSLHLVSHSATMATQFMTFWALATDNELLSRENQAYCSRFWPPVSNKNSLHPYCLAVSSCSHVAKGPA